MHVEIADPGADDALAERLLQVQRAAYRVEAELIGDDRIPPLHETLADLVAADLTWWVRRTSADEVLGAIACSVGAAALEVDRLVVDPAAHRRGIGTALVAAVVDHAGPRPVAVSTGTQNLPARALYRSSGFVEVGEQEPVAGLRTTQLRHQPGQPRPRPAIPSPGELVP